MFRFFIDRPIFATVLAVLVTLAGALAVQVLPLSQYPNVTPPTIQVDCNYPGASSEVVAKTVASPIEQRVNGVERMLYMNAQCTSDGTYTLTITFETGTDLNLAQVLVQNRVNLALPELPEVVRATGVTARKRSPEILLTFALMSPTDKYDQVYLSNYASLHLKEVLTRIDGISDVTIFGQRDFSMRVWVDPAKLEARDLTVLDVVNAVRRDSAEVALGGVGGGGSTRFTVTSLGRLENVEQFEDVIVKVGADGQVVRVRDVAEVAIGAKSNDISNRFDGRQTVGLAIFLQPDANALSTAEELKATMEALSQDFPDGIRYELGYDTTPYIRASIDEVYKSLRDSVVLVAVVVMLFLQSWRSALIPLATVPVAVVGTFAALLACGFGLNTLTLFGLVLAVGIVVDDAIVVVEAVQQQIEKGYAPREATLRAMGEVSGPVVAVGLVLSAVFVPCMFFPGIVGLFFRQFALTIAVSTMISTFNSLTLSPALCAILLKPKAARPDGPQRLIDLLLGWFFRLFNRGFDVGGRAYTWGVGRLLRVAVLVLAGYGGMLAFTGWWYQGAPLEKGALVTPAFHNPFSGADVPAFDVADVAENLRLPTGFIPEQDKGFLIASVQLPDAASAERTRAVIDKVAGIARQTPGIRHVNAVAGNSFVLSAYGSNFGSMFIILDPFDERGPDRHSSKIMPALRKRVDAEVPEAQINIFGAAAVPGLGRAGGMRMMVQDRGEVGPAALFAQTQGLADKGAVQPSLAQVFTPFRVKAPQLYVAVNFAECAANGVDPLDVYATMQATLGQRYVNDFNKFGRTWQVNVQALPTHRDRAEDVKRLKVRSKGGALVPLRALCTVTAVSGPPVITRYNMYPAAALTASVSPGKSSGEAIAVMERLADEQLPRNLGYEWTELTFIEQRSKDTGIFVFVLAVAVVFLVLAALYESWALPFAVILVVPTCVLSSLVGVYFAGQDVNLFTQVGFVVLIGLACKNAILIVEYAKWRREEGADRREAVLAACRQRLRPILMTSLAFILGVAPLAFASGAGAEMRTALGVAVFAGMIGVTAFGIFLTPVFYVVVDRLTEGRWAQSAKVRRTATVLRWAVAFGWVRPLLRKAASVRRG